MTRPGWTLVVSPIGVAVRDVLRLGWARVSIQCDGMEDFLIRDLVQGAFTHHAPRWLRRRFGFGRRILCAACGSLRQSRRNGWSRDAGSIRELSCGGSQVGVRIVFSYREVKSVCLAGFDGKKVEGRQDQGPDAVHVRGAGTPFDIDVAIGARNDSSAVVNSWNEAGICSCCSLLRKAAH